MTLCRTGGPRPAGRARGTGRTDGRARTVRGARAVACALALGCLTVLTAGCGIRATSVPVDAGAAPSRVGCVLPGEEATPSPATASPDDAEVRVYLVCGERVAPVERRVDIPGGSSAEERLPVARELLAALQAEPSAAERTAGFETAVPAGLRVEGPAEGDPEETLRISSPLKELPSFALAQVVCTFAETAAAGSSETVTLGGPPDDSGPPRRYECGTSLRSDPESAGLDGSPV